MSSPRRSDQEHESAPDEDHLTFVDNRILDTKTIRLSADELREAVGDFWEGEDGESDDDVLAPTPEELGMSREEMWLAELERPEMWYDKLLNQPDTPQVAPKVSRSDLRGRYVYTPWTPPEPPMSTEQTVEKRMAWSDWKLLVQYALGQSDDKELQGLMGRIWPARLPPRQRLDPDFIKLQMTESDASHLNLVAKSFAETFHEKAMPLSVQDSVVTATIEEKLQSGKYDDWKQYPEALETLARGALLGVPLEKEGNGAG